MPSKNTKKLKYYTQSTSKKITKSNIPTIENQNIPDKLKAITDKKTGMISIKIDASIIESLSRSLYQNPLACPREYISNEARQVRKTLKLRDSLLKHTKTKKEQKQITKDYNAELWISLDGFSRKLVIEGRNSMGMSIAEFDQIYRVIGKSGNHSSVESGQFGIGILSYLCISDTVLIETWSRETDDKYIITAKNGYAFDVLPTNLTTLKTYGTKCTIILNPDVDLTSLRNYIRDAGKFLKCPVILKTSEMNTYNESINRTRKLGHVDFKKYLHKEVQMSNRQTTNKIIPPTYIHINNKDYELYGCFPYNNYYSKNPIIRLLGMPIDIEHDGLFLIPTNCLLNIKNERKYKPTLSRDTLQSRSLEKLHTNIISDLKKLFSKIKLQTLDDVRKSPYLALMTHHMNDKNSLLRKSFDRISLDLKDICPDMIYASEMLNQNVYAYTSKTHALFNNLKYLKFYELLALNKKILYGYSPDLVDIYSVFDNDPNIVVISIPDKAEDSIGMLHRYRFHIQHISEYIKQKKINTTSIHKTMVNVYKKNHERIIITKSSINYNLLKLPKKYTLKTFLNTLQTCDEEVQNLFEYMYFCKNTKSLNNTKSLSFDDIHEKLKSITFNTSEGVLNGTEISNLYNPKTPIYIYDATLTPEYKNEKDRITFERCKKITSSNLVIFVDDFQKNKKDFEYLFLYLLEKSYNDIIIDDIYNKQLIFKIIDSHTVFKTISWSYVENLGINVTGTWHMGWKKAHEYLHDIKNPIIREMYARFVDINGSWTKIDTHLSPFDQNKYLPDLFLSLDKYCSLNFNKQSITPYDILCDLLSKNIYNNTISPINKTTYNLHNLLVNIIMDCILYPGYNRNEFLTNIFGSQFTTMLPDQQNSRNIHTILKNHTKKIQHIINILYARDMISNKIQVECVGIKHHQDFIITCPFKHIKAMDMETDGVVLTVLSSASLNKDDNLRINGVEILNDCIRMKTTSY